MRLAKTFNAAIAVHTASKNGLGEFAEETPSVEHYLELLHACTGLRPGQLLHRGD
jgi:hypothetical protein